MPTYASKIMFQVDFESGLTIHTDIHSIVQTMFNSLPGVYSCFMMGAGYEITVSYGTYTSYQHDEYMRFVNDTRLKIEELNRNYTDNKNMYEAL